MPTDLDPAILAALREDPKLLDALRKLPGPDSHCLHVPIGDLSPELQELDHMRLAVAWSSPLCGGMFAHRTVLGDRCLAEFYPATCYAWRPDDGSEPEEWFRWPLEEFLADPWDTSLPAWQALVRQSIAGRTVLAAPVVELTVEEVLAAASWGDLDNDVINILNAATEEIIDALPEQGWFSDDKAARDDLLGRIVTAVTAWVETQPRPWREDKERVREVTAEEVAAVTTEVTR